MKIKYKLNLKCMANIFNSIYPIDHFETIELLISFKIFFDVCVLTTPRQKKKY